jgi:hypothetical protein
VYRIQFHSMVFLPPRAGSSEATKQLVAATMSSIVSFTGTTLDRRSNAITFSGPVENSIKDLQVLPGTTQLHVLVHRRRAWHMFTHCAPCPANSRSPAGLVQAGIQGACLCADDYFGRISRAVVDTCRLCRNQVQHGLLAHT